MVKRATMNERSTDMTPYEMSIDARVSSKKILKDTNRDDLFQLFN
jgi:hypothetical protein